MGLLLAGVGIARVSFPQRINPASRSAATALHGPRAVRWPSRSARKPRPVAATKTTQSPSEDPVAAPSLVSAPEPPTTPEPVFVEFNSWLKDYLAADGDKTALENTGRSLAVRRRQSMEKLIERDPQESLRTAVPMAIRQQLPTSVTELLEERVSGNAELAVLGRLDVADDGQAQASIRRYATVNGRTFRAFVYGRRLAQMTESSVPIHGIAVGDALAIHEDPVRVLEPGERPNPAMPVANQDGRCPVSGAAVNPLVAVDVGGQTYQLCCGEHAQDLNQTLCRREDLGFYRRNLKIAGTATWTKGVKTVLFMRVAFADHPQESISAEKATALMDQVSAFFQANSFGLASLQTTVTPVLALPDSVAWYTANEMTLLGDARRAAESAGYATDDYDLDCVFCGSFFALNQAFIGSKGTWLSRMDAGTIAHEFGHNFGLHHANAWGTTDGTSIGAGSNREYGNFFDTMGYGQTGSYSFNAFEKRLLNWLPDSAVTVTSTGGVFRLSPIDVPAVPEGSTCALVIPKDDQRDYWIEIRQAEGDPQLRQGVLVNWSPWAESNGGPQLINCHPQTPGQWALQAGQVFYDLDIGLKIAPLQFLHSASGEEAADIQVSQVYFLPVALSLSPAVPAPSGAPRAQAPRLRQIGAGQPASPSASVEITIPKDDSYLVWVQAVAPDSQSGSFQVTLEDEQGQSGTALKVPTAGRALWSWVQEPASDASTRLVPRPFLFSEGVHHLQIRAVRGQPQTVRLLITNDKATNLPPILSAIPDQVVSAGNSLSLPFFIAAVGQPASNLNVRVSCDDPTLIRDPDLAITGEGADRVLTIASTASRCGTSQVNLSVTDLAGRVYKESFKLTVLGPIQTLIANASPGSTLSIPAGIYYDNVVIDRDLTLEGDGPGQAFINGQANSPTLTVSSNCQVTLKGLTIQNGRLAGVRNFGTLRVLSCVVSGNRGSGIENRGVLKVDDSVLRNNRAAAGGGLNNFGLASLRNCVLSSNVVSGAAGGILNRNEATLTVEASSLTDNQALNGNGGAIQNTGELTLRNCTLCGNLTSQLSGPEPGRSRVTGGAIYNTGTLDLQSCTVCRNQADWEGGGLDNRATLRLRNCIVAENTSLKSKSADVRGNLTSGGHNLIQDPTGCTIDGDLTGNLLGQDAGLAELANHGGLAETVALSPDSPAIDAGECSELMTDQRGAPRGIGAACDMGAFEYDGK